MFYVHTFFAGIFWSAGGTQATCIGPDLGSHFLPLVSQKMFG